MSLVFFTRCNIPAGTAQHKGASIIVPKGGGRPFIHWFTKKEILEAEKQWTAALAPHRPEAPFTGPLSLTLSFIYPWRQSERRSIISKFHRYPVEVRPDVENVAKLCIDVMAKIGFFKDDAQISNLSLQKYYGDECGLGVILSHAKAETRCGVNVTL